MRKLPYSSTFRALVIRVALSLGLLLAMVGGNVSAQTRVAGHGGDASLAHHCAHPESGETRTASPGGLADADFDCQNF